MCGYATSHNHIRYTVHLFQVYTVHLCTWRCNWQSAISPRCTYRPMALYTMGGDPGGTGGGPPYNLSGIDFCFEFAINPSLPLHFAPPPPVTPWHYKKSPPMLYTLTWDPKHMSSPSQTQGGGGVRHPSWTYELTWEIQHMYIIAHYERCHRRTVHM